MKLGLTIVSAAFALSCAAAASSPSGFTGTITGGYGLADAEGISINSYDIGGVADYRFEGTGLNAQAGGSFTRLTLMGESADIWSGSGSVFWRDAKGSIGLFGSYNGMNIVGQDITYGVYGLLGEWYARDDITLRARGGAFSGEGESGAFGGAGATYYVTPDLSVKLDGSYNNFSSIHWFSVTAGAEYLVFRDYPISLGVAYNYSNYTGGPDMSALLVRLTYRLGETGSLVELDRSGPLDLALPNLMLL